MDAKTMIVKAVQYRSLAQVKYLGDRATAKLYGTFADDLLAFVTEPASGDLIQEQDMPMSKTRPNENEIRRRCRRATTAMKAYDPAFVTGKRFDESLVGDLLADLLHLAAAHEVDVEALVKHATGHFYFENSGKEF